MTKVFRSIDTIDYERDGAENNAQHEDVLVGWQGRWVKLDLSHAHFTELDEQLSYLVKIGDPVKPEEAKARRAPAPGRKSYATGGRRSKEYYEGLVEFTDDNRISKRDGTGRPAYAGAKEGRNDYPEWLIKMYDEHLAREAAADPAA